MEVKSMNDKMISIGENKQETIEYSIHTVEVGIRLSGPECGKLKEKLELELLISKIN